MTVNIFKHDSHMRLIFGIFVVITGWWLWLLSQNFSDVDNNHAFAAVYGVTALLGGGWGIWIAQKWGGMKSAFGRALMFMAFGLLAAEFGQIVFSYYNIVLHVPVPYPSLADLGFFANIPLYTIGMLHLAKVAGAQFSTDKLMHKVQVILVPVVLLGIAYYFFLRNYMFDWNNPLKVFLDFGYPLGQAFYVSIAVLTYSLSQKTLGGLMRSRVLLIVGAFVMQFVADYNFLYQSQQGTWVNGGYGDYLYFLAYWLLTVAILEVKYAFNEVQKQ